MKRPPLSITPRHSCCFLCIIFLQDYEMPTLRDQMLKSPSEFWSGCQKSDQIQKVSQIWLEIKIICSVNSYGETISICHFRPKGLELDNFIFGALTSAGGFTVRIIAASISNLRAKDLLPPPSSLFLCVSSSASLTDRRAGTSWTTHFSYSQLQQGDRGEEEGEGGEFVLRYAALDSASVTGVCMGIRWSYLRNKLSAYLKGVPTAMITEDLHYTSDR